MGRPITEEKQNTRIGEYILAGMEAKDLQIRDLSDHLETAYEHMRRIVKGEGIPSKFLLKALCSFLELDYKEAERLITADKIEKQYGSIPQELSGKNPELLPIERAWPHLSAEQKQDVVTMIQGWAKRNRALARVG